MEVKTILTPDLERVIEDVSVNLFPMTALCDFEQGNQTVRKGEPINTVKSLRDKYNRLQYARDGHDEPKPEGEAEG